MSTTHVCFADMPLAAVNQESHSILDVLHEDAMRHCRSISPNCNALPEHRYERNMGFFRQLSRRFGLRSNNDLVFTSSNEDDNQSSSTDSYSSHTPAAATAKSFVGDNNRKDNNLLLSSAQASECMSCASSETSSTVDIEEQLQQLQLQHKPQQQHIVNVNNDDNVNGGSPVCGENDATAVDNSENSDDVVGSGYNRGRKSFARSSFSRLHHRSTTSLRRVFEAFSFSSRSLSCSGSIPPPILPTSSSSSSTNNGTPVKSILKASSTLELNKKSHSFTNCGFKKSSSSAAAVKSASIQSSAASSKTKTKPPPQRILRQPVSYAYLKGISGLPTQRVPRNSVCCKHARR